MKKAIKISTAGTVEELTMTDENGLSVLQEGVGGWVQAIDLDDDLTMWCNEEGKLQNLPHNPFAQVIWDQTFGPGTDYIVGDVVFTGGTDDEGYTLGLSDRASEVIEKVISATRRLIEPRMTFIAQ